MIQLVCFDLGGVLVRLRGSLTAACAVAEVPQPKVLTDPESANAFFASFSSLGMQAATGQVDTEAFFTAAARLTGLTLTQLERVSEALLAGTYPGVADLIGALDRLDVRTACLTNTHHHHWRILTDPATTEYAWLRRLDHRFASHLIGHVKPDARTYRHVEEQTGIGGRQILLFDDRAENCTAARDLGWQAHQILDDDDPVTQIRIQLRAAGVEV